MHSDVRRPPAPPQEPSIILFRCNFEAKLMLLVDLLIEYDDFHYYEDYLRRLIATNDKRRQTINDDYDLRKEEEAT